jgi:hypothetical protein
LASHAVNCAIQVCKRNDLKQEEKSKHVNYYRGLISLLPQIEDDRIVELEDCLHRISALIECQLITETVKKSLLTEYAKITLEFGGDRTTRMENRIKRSIEYMENFKKAIEPLMPSRP